VGCGDVGLRIVARLRDRFRIVATTASQMRVTELRAAGAVPLVVNLDIVDTVRRLRGFAQRWIDLAPPPATGSGDPRTRRLRAACGRRTERAVYVSTTGVYGDRGGALLDETARLAPASERARRRFAAEVLVRAGPIHASVLRVPGIYATNRLPLERLRAGTPALVAADDVYTNHIHADDLARTCVAALHRGRPQRVVHASDDSELKMGDYFDLAAGLCGLQRPQRITRAEAATRLSPLLLSFMSESRRLGNERLTRELRVVLRYPTVREGLVAGLRLPPNAG
jgi:nucleoside-diphosphate-sugar epimerase